MPSSGRRALSARLTRPLAVGQRVRGGVAAVSTGTFLASVLGLLGNQVLTSLATSFIALVVSALSLASKSFRFSEESEAHRRIAARLWDVRESYLSLIADLMSGTTSPADARARRDELQEAARAAYADAPRTTSRAYGRARDGLKNNEELTFTSREIDLFLPQTLRLNEDESCPAGGGSTPAGRPR